MKLRYAEAHVNLGNCHARLGRFREAIASYQLTLEIEPGNHATQRDMEVVRQMQTSYFRILNSRLREGCIRPANSRGSNIRRSEVS